MGGEARTARVGAGCAAPIVVDGRVWGAILILARQGVRLPAGTEARLQGFSDLVATAVSNAAAHEELISSRARIVAAGDAVRRRIERNLHDGTQQRLIALGLDLQEIRTTVPDDEAAVHAGLARMEHALRSTLEDVRTFSRGLHPPLLSRKGLRSALRALTRTSPIPVDIDVYLDERPPEPIETGLYYVAAEAIANAIRHSNASGISVSIAADHGGGPLGIGLDGRGGVMYLHATIADDGVGGADPKAGSGLAALIDRVDALGGRFQLDSPQGGGTRVAIELPLGAQELL
jgi:signal transduction histidine kinase